jgi:hypothetical protein
LESSCYGRPGYLYTDIKRHEFSLRQKKNKKSGVQVMFRFPAGEGGKKLLPYLLQTLLKEREELDDGTGN